MELLECVGYVVYSKLVKAALFARMFSLTAQVNNQLMSLPTAQEAGIQSCNNVARRHQQEGKYIAKLNMAAKIST